MVPSPHNADGDDRSGAFWVAALLIPLCAFVLLGLVISLDRGHVIEATIGKWSGRSWGTDFGIGLGTYAVIIGLALLGWRIRRFRYRFMLTALALFIPACALFLLGSPLQRSYYGPGLPGAGARALAPGLWEGTAIGFLALFVFGIYASCASSRKKVKSQADVPVAQTAQRLIKCDCCGTVFPEAPKCPNCGTPPPATQSASDEAADLAALRRANEYLSSKEHLAGE